jgi:hypothetical protein
MEVYIFHSRLFGSPRIITSNFPINREMLEAMINMDNNYSDESKWKLVDIPLYPESEIK